MEKITVTIKTIGRDTLVLKGNFNEIIIPYYILIKSIISIEIT